MMKKMQEQEYLFLMYESEKELLQFYANLPKRAKKRLKLYQKWHSIAILEEDYEKLKERIQVQDSEDEKPKVTVESNLKFKLHGFTKQIIPWGVTRVQAPEVWGKSEGQKVKVGIIDTGIDGNHPDLKENIAGGVNTLNATSPFLDPNGHGTHVAGTVAAITNEIGVVGVAPKANLYSLKAFDEDGSASLTDIAQAIDWAIDNDIRILNMSFGSRDSSLVLHRAIKAALHRGILMIASAGNSSETLDYPAKHPEVLAVGAINKKNKIADFSNYGNTLNYVEPGVDILSTWPVAPGYNTLSGTSMATPHLVGICALLLAEKPDLAPHEVKRILDRSAVRLPGISRTRQGRGLILATRAGEELIKSSRRTASPS